MHTWRGRESKGNLSVWQGLYRCNWPITISINTPQHSVDSLQHQHSKWADTGDMYMTHVRQLAVTATDNWGAATHTWPTTGTHTRPPMHCHPCPQLQGQPLPPTQGHPCTATHTRPTTATHTKLHNHFIISLYNLDSHFHYTMDHKTARIKPITAIWFKCMETAPTHPPTGLTTATHTHMHACTHAHTHMALVSCTTIQLSQLSLLSRSSFPLWTCLFLQWPPPDHQYWARVQRTVRRDWWMPKPSTISNTQMQLNLQPSASCITLHLSLFLLLSLFSFPLLPCPFL